MKATYTFTEDVARGSALEHMVACMFRTICGFKVTEQYRTGTLSVVDGCRITVDGFIHPCEQWPHGLMYECKSQDVSGSAHNRMPKHIVDAKEGMYPAPLMFIIDGAFFAKQKPGQHIFQWMKDQIDGERIVAVVNTSEFVTWCQREKGRGF